MIKLRLATTTQDMNDLFRWRNDPFIYKKFFNPKPVAAKEHEKWFDYTIMNSSCRLFIISFEDQERLTKVSIGQLRFDRGDDGMFCEVSIGLPEAYTGKGYGPEAIRQGCQRIHRSIWPGIEILARFVPQNCPSKSAFRKAGFTFKNEQNITMVYMP